MKKLTAIILAALLLFSLCSCAGKTEAEPEADTPTADVTVNDTAETDNTEEILPEENVGLANPYVEYDSLEEINALTGGRLCSPAVMGVTDDAYYIIETTPRIAQYNFTVNDNPYSFRFSSDYTTDISGIYGESGDTIFAGNTIGETAFVEGLDFKSACFYTVDGQYVLTVVDNAEMERETFENIVSELAAMVTPAEEATSDDLLAYEGDWYEQIAGRGTITITADGYDLSFDVRWPNSAAEVYETTFSGTLDGDTLVYSNGTSTSYIFAEDGSVSEESVRYTDGTGTVTFNVDGTFTWVEDGINDEGSVFCKN